MKNKAINALIEIGIPESLRGFNYIVDAMCLFEEDVDFRLSTSILFIELGKKYNVQEWSIERCIRYALSVAIKEGNPKVVNKYLGSNKKTTKRMLNRLYTILSYGGNHAD